jgi:hypothetical protein
MIPLIPVKALYGHENGFQGYIFRGYPRERDDSLG